MRIALLMEEKYSSVFNLEYMINEKIEELEEEGYEIISIDFKERHDRLLTIIKYEEEGTKKRKMI